MIVWGSPHAKVGHRQASKYKTRPPRKGRVFYLNFGKIVLLEHERDKKKPAGAGFLKWDYLSVIHSAFLRLLNPRPTRPRPSKASVAGSGTVPTTASSIPNPSLVGSSPLLVNVSIAEVAATSQNALI